MKEDFSCHSAFVTGLVSSWQNQNSESLLEANVGSGDDITLYCDCRLSVGVYIMWLRNCSHENQPPLVLNVYDAYLLNKRQKSHFELVRNFSSDSYDLLIRNVTSSDEGFYYCGTEKVELEVEEHITKKTIYRYSNIITRVTLGKYLYLKYL